MINTAKQLKDLIRNLSKKKSADAQIFGNGLGGEAGNGNFKEHNQYSYDWEKYRQISICKSFGHHIRRNFLMHRTYLGRWLWKWRKNYTICVKDK